MAERFNAYGLDYAWRFALAGFLLLVAISTILLAVFHRNFFTGLFGAYGVLLGTAIGTSGRRRRGRLRLGQAVRVAALLVGGFVILGWTLQVTGLLPR